MLPRPVLASWFLLVAACDGKLAFRQEGVIRGRVPLPAEVKRLEIEVDFGSITVLAEDATPDAVTFDGSTLRAADTAADLQTLASIDLTLLAATDGGVLRLHSPALPGSVPSANARMVVRGVVRCPSRLQVAIRTAIGSVKVDHIAADVDVRTGQGEIAVSACQGLVALHSERGDIMVDRHRGGLVLTAPNGSVRAFLAELGPAGVRVSARSEVQLHLPRTTPFTLRAGTERGRCHNSFGVSVVLAGQRASMAGDVGGGGPLLDLRSTGGSVTVSVTD